MLFGGAAQDPSTAPVMLAASHRGHFSAPPPPPIKYSPMLGLSLLGAGPDPPQSHPIGRSELTIPKTDPKQAFPAPHYLIFSCLFP